MLRALTAGAKRPVVAEVPVKESSLDPALPPPPPVPPTEGAAETTPAALRLRLMPPSPPPPPMFVKLRPGEKSPLVSKEPVNVLLMV